ncbi:hypothetical protein V5O48_004476, partial [Marasmius crinis-equi]
MKLPGLLFPVLLSLCHGANSQADPITVTTTSGRLQGAVEDGVMSFKGVRFGQSPTGLLRWQPPRPFLSTGAQDATKLGPSCIQQFAFATANLSEFLFNNPPPPEDEDCLFLNVWAPASTASNTALKPVLVWMYGGSLAFGTGSLPAYDGTSLAKNQGVVVVTFNYRTNVFGFPSAPDLPLTGNNLGFLDQELVLGWVQANIRQFGGNRDQVTIMGQSAGSVSVAAAITRQQSGFRAGIMLSGASVTPASSAPDFTPFNEFADAVNCKQSPGLARLACLRQVPAPVIRNFTNGPSSGAFRPVTDNFTNFGDPLGRILAKQTTLGMNNLTEFLSTTLPGVSISPDQIRMLYPGRDDHQVIEAFATDTTFRCPVSLWAATFVQAGIRNVFRYTYGAVFPDLQLFPDAGAWHSSELELIFGTFNRTTSSESKATLSKSLQTAIANFIKDPTHSPAPNWNQYDPNGRTLAELSFDGNVDFDDFVNPVTSQTE